MKDYSDRYGWKYDLVDGRAEYDDQTFRIIVKRRRSYTCFDIASEVAGEKGAVVGVFPQDGVFETHFIAEVNGDHLDLTPPYADGFLPKKYRLGKKENPEKRWVVVLYPFELNVYDYEKDLLTGITFDDTLSDALLVLIEKRERRYFKGTYSLRSGPLTGLTKRMKEKVKLERKNLEYIVDLLF